MIKLTRTTDKSLLPKSLSGRRRIDKNKELLRQKIKILKGEITGFEFKTQYWKAAKDALKAESYNKCAYCESSTAIVAHGDVEHFRPKSEYWWLAYTYHNYLYSCQICNQSYKSIFFPIRGAKLIEPAVLAITDSSTSDVLCAAFGPDPINTAAGMSLTDFKENHKNEMTSLPDPCLDNPETFFVWKADDILREVVIAAKGKGKVNAARLKAVEDYLGLNRKELRVERYNVYETFTRFKKLSKSSKLSVRDKKDIQAEIKKMTAANFPYAAMCRFYDRIL